MFLWVMIIFIVFFVGANGPNRVIATEQAIVSPARARFLPAWADPECGDDIVVIDSWTGQLYHIEPRGGECVDKDNWGGSFSEDREWRVISRPIARPDSCNVDNCATVHW